MGAGLAAAKDAGIPVFGMDSGSDPLLVTNVTSNGYAMAAQTSAYVVNRLNGSGKVVMFVFDAFPPVQARGVIADAVFGNYPDIEVLERITPDVADGGIADSRAQMEALLAANPDKGSIQAVWAAWDQPALGALQAIEDADRATQNDMPEWLLPHFDGRLGRPSKDLHIVIGVLLLQQLHELSLRVFGALPHHLLRRQGQRYPPLARPWTAWK